MVLPRSAAAALEHDENGDQSEHDGHGEMTPTHVDPGVAFGADRTTSPSMTAS
jgi:hypothetical protein